MNHSVILSDKKNDLPSESIYRTHVDLDTLEVLSKLKPLSSTKNQIRHRSSLRAGIKYSTNTGGDMSNLISHNFMRDYLENKVTRNALEFHKVQTFQPRDENNKSSVLRKNRIAMSII